MTAMKHQPIRARCGIIAAVAVLVCLGCPSAEAHLVTTGLGPVYDGIAHLALSPADMAVVVVLVLLAAMRGARHGRWVLALLPMAWLAGGVAGLMFPINASLGWATGLSLLVAGALVAADRNLTLPVVAVLAALIGAFHGYLTGAAFAREPSAALELTGELAALIVVATLVAGLVLSVKAFWARVVLRVMGSWIAAMGLLLIGWSLRAGN
jgi:hydrogenase/urease accessory protein HupE